MYCFFVISVMRLVSSRQRSDSNQGGTHNPCTPARVGMCRFWQFPTCCSPSPRFKNPFILNSPGLSRARRILLWVWKWLRTPCPGYWYFFHHHPVPRCLLLLQAPVWELEVAKITCSSFCGFLRVCDTGCCVTWTSGLIQCCSYVLHMILDEVTRSDKALKQLAVPFSIGPYGKP